MVRMRAGISYEVTEAMDEGYCGLPRDELVPLTAIIQPDGDLSYCLMPLPGQRRLVPRKAPRAFPGARPRHSLCRFQPTDERGWRSKISFRHFLELTGPDHRTRMFSP